MSTMNTGSGTLGSVTQIDPTIDALITTWLLLPDVADRLGVDVSRVRQLIREHQLVATRRGERNTLQVPAELLDGDKVIKGLPGTLTLLADAGFSDEEVLRWLFTVDDSLPGSPVNAMREHRGVEVKRRAQALGF